jgi:hypothetical protein
MSAISTTAALVSEICPVTRFVFATTLGELWLILGTPIRLGSDPCQHQPSTILTMLPRILVPFGELCGLILFFRCRVEKCVWVRGAESHGCSPTYEAGEMSTFSTPHQNTLFL